MDYLCKVGTPAGEVIERSFSARDESALRSELERQGYYLFSIRRGLGMGDWALKRRRVKPAVLLVFGQELAALLRAGLPLLQSLDITLERQREPLFRRSLGAVRERVKSGWSLSDAFGAEGELYPPMFSASLVAGERTGDLETVLSRFVQYVRLNQTLKRKAVTASVYPMVLVAMMMGLAAILLIVVIPQFEPFYEAMDAELPLATRVLMALARGVRENLFWIVAAVFLAAAGLRVWLGRQGSGQTVDRLLLRLPFVGGMMRMYATSQLARTLSTLLAGGLPLLSALEVAAASVGNRALAAAVSSSTPQIREGKSLTVALESTGMLEDLPLEMIRVGEQTGALGEMLTSVADFYDEELDTKLAMALALAEPVLLVLMALVVAGMLLAFYLPMFQAIGGTAGGL
jgi:type IV pilus assembly protein PilC